MTTKGSRTARIFYGIILGGLGIFLALVLCVSIVLTPKVLTGVVNKIAGTYIDGDLSFGKVSASLFERFPKVTISMDSVLLSYPTERFAAEELKGDFHLRTGKSEISDTLAAFDRFSASLNLLSLMGGQLRLPQVELHNPRIFIKNYNDSLANWKVYKPISSPDTETEQVSDSLPNISIDKLLLDGKPLIVYCSKPDTLYASAHLHRMKFDGRLSTRQTEKNRIKFVADSIFVAGRMKRDTLAVRLDRLSIDEHKDHIDFKLAAKTFIATRAYGRIMLPISIDSHIKFNPDTVPSISVKDLEAQIADISINANADVKYSEQNLDVKGDIEIDKAFSLDMKGSIDGFNGNDPLYMIDAKMNADLDAFSKYLPKDSLILMSGKLSAKAKGKIRRSQMNTYKFAGAQLEGFLRSDCLRLESPRDSINVHVDSLDVLLVTLSDTSRFNTLDDRAISFAARVDSSFVEFKNVLRAEGRKLAFMAQNDIALLDGRDSGSVYPFSGKVKIGYLSLTDSDSSKVFLRESENSFRITPADNDKSIPVLELKSNNEALFGQSGVNRATLNKLSLNATATRAVKRERHGRERRQTQRPVAGNIPDWLAEEDFRKSDFSFKLDNVLTEYYKNWEFNGDVLFRQGTVVSPYFPLFTRVGHFSGKIDNNSLTLDSLKINSGSSNLSAKGKINGLRGALLANFPLRLDLSLSSNRLNLNELLNAYSLGSRYMAAADTLSKAFDDEAYMDSALIDSLANTLPAESSLLVVPANIIASLKIDATNVLYSNLDINRFSSQIVMKERCIQLRDTEVQTNVGRLDAEAFYSTATKQNIRAGFNLGLSEITADKLINMMPAVDTLMPMLKSFKGLLDCEIAATSQLDTNMNLIMPTLKGIIRINGKDLAMVDNQELHKVAKILKFKDKNNIRINDMTVEGIIADNKVELFPFLLTAERYTLALSGIHRLDQSFQYHISVLSSPMVLRFGVNFWGDNFDDFNFKLGKAKYKNRNIPVFSAVINETKLNLSNSINNIFSRGVNAAIHENERMEAIRKYREKIKFENAAEEEMEPLSKEEELILSENPVKVNSELTKNKDE